MEKWEADRGFDEQELVNVERVDDGYALKRADGWSLFVSDPGFEPKAGQRARFYGEGIGRPVRGVVIEGRVIYYRDPKEDEAYQRNRLYPETAIDALYRWDRGEIVWTISLGGTPLGPGYEQCIHIAIFELIRDALAQGWAPDVTAPRLASLGLTGAQWDAARWFAQTALRDGWQDLVLRHPEDRRMQVSRHWPQLEGPIPAADEGERYLVWSNEHGAWIEANDLPADPKEQE